MSSQYYSDEYEPDLDGNYDSKVNVNAGTPLIEVLDTLDTPQLQKGKRSFADMYAEANNNEERDALLFKKLYTPLLQAGLENYQKACALYRLGDAIASGNYPKPKRKSKEKEKLLAYTKTLSQQELDTLFDEIMVQLNGKKDEEKPATA